MVLIRKLLVLENGKDNKKNFCPKVDVWAYLRSNVKTPLNHTIWGPFESSWASKNEKKLLRQKVEVWTYSVFNFKSPLNHTRKRKHTKTY